MKDESASYFILPPFSFILAILAGTTRLELANQLIEGQPAFHFAFIPVVIFDCQLPIAVGSELAIGRAILWCARRDSNSHKADLKSAASSNWATRAHRSGVGTRGGIRTHTAQILNLLSPANWTTRARMKNEAGCLLLLPAAADSGTGGGIRTHTV